MGRLIEKDKENLREREKGIFLPLSIALSPRGHPYLHSLHTVGDERVGEKDYDAIQALWTHGMAKGLLRLGIVPFSESLPPSLAFWQAFAHRFVLAQCQEQETTQDPSVDEWEEVVLQAPFMFGGEYLTASILQDIWRDLKAALAEELIPYQGHLRAYLSQYNTYWQQVGRMCFHLAENKGNLDYPFAFLATYISQISATDHTPRHLPLGRALKEYSHPDQKHLLLSLLTPVQRAAAHSRQIRDLVDSGEIFKPQYWTAQDAYLFLKSIPQLEEAGIMIRCPDWWKAQNPPRPRIETAIGIEKKVSMGLGTLMDFQIKCALPNGEMLTEDEWTDLLNAQGNLVRLKGQWVEINPEQLNEVLSYWKQMQRDYQNEGLSFAESLRLLSGMGSLSDTSSEASKNVAQWSVIIEGDALKESLDRLRHPERYKDADVEAILSKYLKATLRPYQIKGVQWLWSLYTLQLGGCLADDMGLGKTMQIISLLLCIKYARISPSHQAQEHSLPSLLVLPASLLGNWQKELEKFAPDLRVWVAHSSANKTISLEERPDLTAIDVVITTYGLTTRLPWLKNMRWHAIFLDEAQAIKNAGTKQTHAVKNLQGFVKFILTGTPVENKLSDLWSLFDFVAPGLLGSSKQFSHFIKSWSASQEGLSPFYRQLRQLLSPYILRRLKTDRRIIQDLPDKTEMTTYTPLSKNQAVLYQSTVNELAMKLDSSETNSIGRKGLVLNYLMKLKQICNHPDQMLGHGAYTSADSGKFLRLKELCEEIAARQEKVLVFTQFSEIIPALSAYLEEIFGRPGLSLDGQTPIKERMKRVDAFQQEQGPPFFVLSLKAGGTGLTLTHANHVIHFDRWWNPAVENQATDRAFRIGQKKNVLVHKFVSQGTLEEKIDALIESKKILSESVLEQTNEISLTEMSNDALLKMISLDLSRALQVD